MIINTNLPPSANKYKVQIMTNGKAIEVHPQGKYSHSRYPMRNPTGSPKPPSKKNWRKPSFNYKRVDGFYPDHVNTLRKAGLAPPIFPIMGELWKVQDEKTDIVNDK